MDKLKKYVLFSILCTLVLSLCAFGNQSNDNSAVYEEIIEGLDDNELFAIIDVNASLPVLLVSSEVYNDGRGNQASLMCDVYYPVGNEVKNIGTLESFGTAYPVSYDKTGIYIASGHSLHRFEIEESGTIKLAEAVYEQFDESGIPAYTVEKEGKTEVITEEKYNTAVEKYGNTAVVNFAHGA